ncbi:ion transporter [Candidatus Paracaedibacter symbiosus]|uniref:ion transporter n=1 Tax=Candidatus Paracaedibacter symbiosus TaxID=244582 RepID=UPI000509FC5A|nr:ion transporter [Candidatus Paracaedibacter symbiosus]
MTPHAQNFREKLGAFFESHSYHVALTALLILSIFSIGYELSTTQTEGLAHAVFLFNRLVVVVFTIEIVARIIAHGPAFFKDPWHVFDFVVIIVSLISFGGYFQLFRAFRLFWLLRLVSIFPQFQHIVDAIGKAIPHLVSTAVLMFVAVYIFALLGMACFGADHPEMYGTIWGAMITIFKSVMMEHTWSDQLAELSKTTPYAWVFVVPMIIVLNFLLLQLVFGIVIGALMRQHAEEEHVAKHHFFAKWLKGDHTSEEEQHHISAETKILLHEIQKLKQEVKDLKK